jgi:hypothetical protein
VVTPLPSRFFKEIATAEMAAHLVEVYADLRLGLGFVSQLLIGQESWSKAAFSYEHICDNTQGRTR